VEICKWIRNFLTDIARSDRKMLGSLSLAGARRSLTGVRSLLGRSHSVYSTCVRDRTRSWRKHVTRNVNVQLQHCLRSAPPLTTAPHQTRVRWSPSLASSPTAPCFVTRDQEGRWYSFFTWNHFRLSYFSFIFQRCEKKSSFRVQLPRLNTKTRRDPFEASNKNTCNVIQSWQQTCANGA
jgi:hypothetical protein